MMRELFARRPRRFAIRLLHSIGLFALLASTGLAQWERQPPNPYRDILRKFSRVRDFSGAVLVAKGDEVLFRGAVGLADRDWQQRNAADTKFRIGSLTKAFTAAVVMQLVAEGKLSVEQSLASALPWYREDTGERVTVHHLLTHTSGIPSFTNGEGYDGLKRNFQEVRPFVEEHCSGDLEFEPGSQFRYNNSGYFILGAIIEQAAGQRFDVALRERIFEPLGLRNTGYDRHGTPVPRRAHGYQRVGGVVVAADLLDMSVPFAAGALYSTVDDLLVWYRAVCGGSVLDEVSRKATFSDHASGYGYGWGIRSGDGGTQISHTGGIDGFLSRIGNVPECDGVVVVLSNVMDPAIGEVWDAMAARLRGKEPREVRRDPVAAIWRRVHGGDLAGAKRLAEGVAARAVAPGITAQRLERSGHLAEAAAAYRFDVALHPDAALSRERLARLESTSTAGPQFVEQLECLPGPIVWSEGVHACDLDGDGRLDLVFSNCNGWRKPGDMAAPSEEPLLPTILRNRETKDSVPIFEDVSVKWLPAGFKVHSKNLVVCDLDGDGIEELVFATAFGAQPRLLRRASRDQPFVDETSARLPEMKLNSNGVSFGDLDDDGDLDLVFVDSGPNSDKAPGGKARLLLNDGSGRFVDAPDRLGAVEKIGAQNAKIVDIDGDLDLDIILDGKSTVTHLYRNNGAANFTLDLKTIPEAASGGQPYEIEWGDLDGDGDFDAVHMSWGGSRRERYRNVLLRNKLAESGALGFDVVMDAFDGRNNEDENEFALFDTDDDGDLDLIVATLISGPVDEKLFVNAGSFGPGFLRQRERAFSHFADGTLDLTIADFDGDGAHDIVTAQGESTPFEDFRNRFYKNAGPKDSRPPTVVRAAVSSKRVFRVQIADAIVDDGESRCSAWLVHGDTEHAMRHVGGQVFRAAPENAASIDPAKCVVKLRDAVGNESITKVEWQVR